jgi:hypothetical protein
MVLTSTSLIRLQKSNRCDLKEVQQFHKTNWGWMKIDSQTLDKIADITILASIIVMLTVSGIAAIVLHHRDVGSFLFFVVLLLLLSAIARKLKARTNWGESNIWRHGNWIRLAATHLERYRHAGSSPELLDLGRAGPLDISSIRPRVYLLAALHEAMPAAATAGSLECVVVQP